MVLLVGIGMMVLSLISIFCHDTLAESKEAWPICTFGGVAVYSALYKRARLRAGWRICYQVSVSNGSVVFSQDDQMSTERELAKLTQMWVKVTRPNMSYKRVEIMAICGKKLINIFDAGDL